jgi:type II secretory pathway pseudopilin PulG
MPVTAQSRKGLCRPGLPRAAGLTLLEVLAATAIVLITCVAVTTLIVTAARAGGRAEGVAAADEALLAEAARLRALSFFVPLPADWVDTRDTATPSAVGELFPHADVALNTDDARFLISGDCAGAFETSVLVQGLTVRRTAWMARCDGSGWSSVTMEALDGWRAWGGAAVPAEALVVRLVAPVSRAGSVEREDSRARGLTFVLSAGGRPGTVDPEALADGAEGWAP